MYIYIYIYVHIYTYICTLDTLFLYLGICIHIYTYTYIYKCTCIYISIYMYICMYIIIACSWVGRTCAATKHIDLLLSFKGILCLDVHRNVLEANHRTNLARVQPLRNSALLVDLCIWSVGVCVGLN